MTVEPQSVCALVPCHREPPAAELVAGLVARVGRVLVVDDGLRRDAARALDRIASAHGAEVLRMGGNHGKGHALARGLAHLRDGDVALEAVLVLDGDGQHPVEAVTEFLAAADGAELLVGDRFGDLASMPRYRRLANRFVSRLLGRVAGVMVRDSQCGMRLLRGRALHAVAFPGGRFESETLHLKRCLVQGVAVAWVPIPAIYRGQPSSFRPLRDGIRVLAAVRDEGAVEPGRELAPRPVSNESA